MASRFSRSRHGVWTGRTLHRKDGAERVSSRPIDGPLEPGNHAVHDLLVVPFQHHRMAVAEDARLGQHVDSHAATDRRHLLLKLARSVDAVLGVVADHDQDWYGRKLLPA